MIKRIQFLKIKDYFGFCSNFAKYKVEYNGKTYFHSEGAYQAQKFPDNPEIQEEICLMESPFKAAKMGRDKSLPIRKDWDKDDLFPEPPAILKVKDRIMYEIVLAKFQQHPDIAAQLIDSGDAYIVEDTSHAEPPDNYWGETSPGVGQNRLGHILMRVREELRIQNYAKNIDIYDPWIIKL